MEAIAVEGFLCHYGWNSSDKNHYLAIINEGMSTYYMTNVSLEFVNNEKRKGAIENFRIMAEHSSYSWIQYPIKIRLYADRNKNIKKIFYTYRLLKGFISDFNTGRNTVRIQRKSPSPQIESIDDMDFLGPSDLPPNMDAWKKFTENEHEFEIPADMLVRCNHQPIEVSDIAKYIGREIHVMLDEKDQPVVFNIYKYDEKVLFAEAACSGYVLFWENNFSRVRIWKFASHAGEEKMTNLAADNKKQLIRLIKENKIDKYGILKADYRFSKNVRFYREAKELKLSHNYPLKENIQVNNCFFYGPAYINYNKQGEVETVFVPYEYAE